MVNKNYTVLYLCLLTIACGAPAAQNSTSQSTATKTEPAPELIYVYESSLSIVWDNGIQTSHYLHGPGTTAYVPDDQWRYVLRGATANSIEFYLPLAHVRKAVWRTVWLPQHTAMRLLYGYHMPDTRCPCERTVVQTVTPFDGAIFGDGPVHQDPTHPLDAPRVVAVDITDAVNTAFSGNPAAVSVQFAWEVQAMNQSFLPR